MKIGITTQYYKSNNYGGNLQAYALCKYIEKLGHSAEQICFPLKLTPINLVNNKKTLKDKIKDTILSIKITIYKLTVEFFHNKFKFRDIGLRIKAVKKFNKKKIPHSKKIYNEMNISKTINKYDCFITGSDIVWDSRYTSSIFLLDFVKKKSLNFLMRQV